jgi:dTDP-glucose 4,6-dehydratase
MVERSSSNVTKLVSNASDFRMKILVTGGLGVVGRPLVKELRKRGCDVWVMDISHHHDAQYIRCDVGEIRQLQEAFKTIDFDYVYHLAAEFGRHNGEDFYETMWKSNVIGTKNVIKLQEQKKFRMIFTSSSEIYGDYQGVMTEDLPMKQPIRQLNDYAISKWVNEQQIMNSASRFGTETVRLRLFNSYGPGEYYSPYRSAVCIFVYRALLNLPYTVYVRNRRTLTYIDDMVNALANVIGNFKSGEVYNISGDYNATMKEVSDIILSIMRKDDSFVHYESTEKHNALNKVADNTKAKQDLRYKTSVSLEEGLKRTIEWQRKVYSKRD